MNDLDKLQAQRQLLVDQIAQTDTMLRGKITVTSPTREDKDGQSYTAGPYFKLQCWQEGKNVTRYITSEDYPALKEYVDNYHDFKALCEELAEVTEQITVLSDQQGVVAKAIQTRKKKHSKRSASKRSKISSSSSRKNTSNKVS